MYRGYKKMKGLPELNDTIESVIETLMSGELSVSAGTQINKAVSNRINSLKVELVYSQLTGIKPSIPFLDDALTAANKIKKLA